VKKNSDDNDRRRDRNDSNFEQPDEENKNPKMPIGAMGGLPYFDKMKPPQHQEMMMFPQMGQMPKNFFPGMGGMPPYGMPGNMFMNPYMRSMPIQPPMFPGPKLANPKKFISDMAKTLTMQDKSKDKEKVGKKEGDDNKVLNIVQQPVLNEIFKSIQISLKTGNELLFLNTCKKILGDLETKAKDKKMKTLSKDIPEFLTSLHDKIKNEILDKKDKKKTSSNEFKISEYEMIKQFHGTKNIFELLSTVPFEKHKIDQYFQEIPEFNLYESEESSNLLEEARGMFKHHAPGAKKEHS